MNDSVADAHMRADPHLYFGVAQCRAIQEDDFPLDPTKTSTIAITHRHSKVLSGSFSIAAQFREVG
ncbi:MAG: hypothetical protein R3C01_05315 [Planctomycetaceae bacterium]